MWILKGAWSKFIENADMSIFWNRLKLQSGATLIEATIAMFIFFVVMVAGGAFFYGGNMKTDRATVRRLAVNKAIERMEYLTGLNYDQLSGQAETATSILLGSTAAFRTTAMISVDDSLDGLGVNDDDLNLIDYKRVTVEIFWIKSDTQSVVLETIFYPNRLFLAS
ncbi:MAG: type IV pilus modification PilV family protein [Candidatus Zhuqueibacterota bacterium]